MLLQNFTGDLHIVKRKLSRSCNLNFFVSLTREQNDVSSPRFAYSNIYRSPPIRFDFVSHPRFLQTHECVVNDAKRIFTAWIVGSKHRKIAASPCGFSHERTLGTVPIAAAAEKRNHPAPVAGLLHEAASKRGQVP